MKRPSARATSPSHCGLVGLRSSTNAGPANRNPGILPREPSLAHYQERVDELVGAVPEPARLVVRRYVRWAVTRPLQAQVDTGATITEGLVR